jgi:hypothetical protein
MMQVSPSKTSSSSSATAQTLAQLQQKHQRTWTAMSRIQILVLINAILLSFALGYFYHPLRHTMISALRPEFFSPSSSLTTAHPNQRDLQVPTPSLHENSYNNSSNLPSWDVSSSMANLPQFKQSHVNQRSTTLGQGTSSSFFSLEYYESLVHPAMFTHENPQRVAILLPAGRGTQGIEVLREVLKHNTVLEVVVFGLDPQTAALLSTAWSDQPDCSNLQPRRPPTHTNTNDDNSNDNHQPSSPLSRLDDDRISIVSDNAIEWFTRRYPPSEQDETDEVEGDPSNPVFDVIILDPTM